MRPTETTVRVRGGGVGSAGGCRPLWSTRIFAGSMPSPISQCALASVTGRDDVGGRVGHARQPAGQARRGEAAPGRVAVARGGQVGLAHVDAVLGEDHRRAVQRLVHERGDRRPARGGHVQHVGVGRRRRRGARDPVERLVERRRLDEVERRRRAGLGRRARRGPRAAPPRNAAQPRSRAERAAHAGRVPPAPRPRRDDGVGVALPADQVAHEHGGQRRRRGRAERRGRPPRAAPRTTPRSARPRGRAAAARTSAAVPSGATIGSTCQSNPAGS